MQGDIFQLYQLQSADSKKSKQVTFTNSNTTANTPIPLKVLQQRQPLFVSIYNEDDLSHFLHQGIINKPFDNDLYSEAHDHAHYLGAIASAFDDYCSDDAMPAHGYSDESAIASDEDDDLVLTPGAEDMFIHHHLSVESGSPRPSLISLGLADKSHAFSRPVTTTTQNTKKAVEEVAAVQEVQVESIEGPLMSLWPLPIDMQEYEWSEKKYAANRAAVPETQHVSNIERPCMSWWPTPVYLQEHEWNERFYE
jgi:hypothetical protein